MTPPPSAPSTPMPPGGFAEGKTGERTVMPLRGTMFGYLLRQTFGPFLFFTLVFAGLIWLIQSLQVLDQIIASGQTAVTFFYVSLLALPALLSMIFPISLFCGLLYALNKLQSESELVIMLSAGIGRIDIVKPILLLAGGVTLLNYAFGLYMMPASERVMKDRVYEIRNDLAPALIREGEFTVGGSGLTVYIRAAPTGGDLKGILVHDNRNRERPITYMAERGVFLRTPEGTRLMMVSGQSQWMEARDGNLQIVRFDSYALDLDQFTEQQRRRNVREASERYLHELFYPEERARSREWKRLELLAEGHNRLASPLYNIAFALIVFVAIVAGPFSRRGYPQRIAIAAAGAIGLRFVGFGVASSAAQTPALNIVQYLIPLGAIAACLYITLFAGDWKRPAAAGGEPPAPDTDADTDKEAVP